MRRTALAIRFGTFGAGVLFGLLAGLWLLLNAGPRTGSLAAEPVAAWIADATWAELPRTRRVATRATDGEESAPVLAEGASGDGLSLWVFEPEGSVALLSAEQFRSCIAARREQRDEAGCPPRRFS